MEKAGLRRFNFALFQDQQTGSGRAAIETQLRIHFHSHHDRVGDENIFACQRANRRSAVVLPCAAHRTHTFLAGCFRFRWHSCERDRDHDLRQSEIFWRNFRVRYPSFAMADLKNVIPSESLALSEVEWVEESRDGTQR